MRGAALKLGQFMSIQGAYPSLAHQTASSPSGADVPDNNMLPPEIEKVLQQVQAHANYMPDWQMEERALPSLPLPQLI